MTDIEARQTLTAEAFTTGVEWLNAVTELRACPPLVFAPECELLKERLARVARGEAFVLEAGDRTEPPGEVSADAIRGRLKTLLQMSALLTYATSVPVVKISRLARQQAPASTCPRHMLHTYQSSAATLNLVRAFASGGYADLCQVQEWNRDYAAASPSGDSHTVLLTLIERALTFMRACGTAPEDLATDDFFASHTPRLLDYESALTRADPGTGRRYNTSAQLLRTGDPARDPDESHLAYLTTISNPVAVTLGPRTTPDEALSHLARLDPSHEPGRLTFIARMGTEAVRDRLPALIEKVAAQGHEIPWICDPLDGPAELRAYFEVHRTLGTHPGGIHVELTGEGGDRHDAAALDLAFLVADLYGAGAI